MSEEKAEINDYDHPFKDDQHNLWLQSLAKTEGKTTEVIFKGLKEDEKALGIPVVNLLYSQARSKGLIGGIRKLIIMPQEGKPLEIGVELIDTKIIKNGIAVNVKGTVGIIYGISAPRTRQTYKELELVNVSVSEEKPNVLPPIKGLQPEKMSIVKEKCLKAGKKGFEETISGTITSVEQPTEKFSAYKIRIADTTFKGAFSVTLDNDAIERFGIAEILEKPKEDDNGEKEYELKPLENRPAKIYAWWNVQKAKTGGREFVNGYPYYIWINGMPRI